MGVLQVNKEKLDLMVHKVLKVPLELQEQSVKVVLQVQVVHLANKVLLVNPVNQVFKVILVPPDHKVQQVRLVKLVCKVTSVPMVPKVKKVTEVILVCQVLKGKLDKPVRLVNAVQKALEVQEVKWARGIAG